MNIREAIKYVIEMKDLKEHEAYEVAIDIMSGETTDSQIAALLTAMKIKGETVDEITGFVKAMREKVTRLNCGSEYLIDTCGTGGDKTGTFNISTISAFIAAGAGCRVAKHGNRSVSSKCGSADLLEEMGINIKNTPEIMEKSINEEGIGFLFAPTLHKAMKYAIGPRREIGIRTIFNILGPLTNPAGAKRQLLGVFNRELMASITYVLKNLCAEHCLIVHGEDGLDEITTTGKTFVSELNNGTVNEYEVIPYDFNLKPVTIDDIKGGSAKYNAKIAFDILKGRKGPKRDITVFNAGAAIYVSGKANSLSEGIEIAKESIDSGKALEKFKRLKEMMK
jgi:anthranilate phosphoribosyltransferase